MPRESTPSAGWTAATQSNTSHICLGRSGLHLPSPQPWTLWGQVGNHMILNGGVGEEFKRPLYVVIPGALGLQVLIGRPVGDGVPLELSKGRCQRNRRPPLLSPPSFLSPPFFSSSFISSPSLRWLLTTEGYEVIIDSVPNQAFLPDLVAPPRRGTSVHTLLPNALGSGERAHYSTLLMPGSQY